MIKKFTAFFTGIIMALLSIFGISFKHTENSPGTIYFPFERRGGNEYTDSLKMFYSDLQNVTPEVTVCGDKKPYPDDDRIEAVFISTANGHRAFAYVGFPKGASAQSPVPAMVLVHGGGGTAFAEYVKLWVDRGYAAISVDYCGHIPVVGDNGEIQLTDNPDHPKEDTFASAGQPLDEQWFFYYIANSIMANNYFRADSRIDSDKIGITGVSWGGLATSVTVCYDSRYAFAVPVYGCGFLHESKAYFLSIMSPEGVANVWEPSLLLGEVKTPILWISGDSDVAFSVDALTKSAASAENSQIAIIPSMVHSHQHGFGAPEVYRYAESMLGRGEGNPEIEKISFGDDNAVLTLKLPKDARKTEVYAYYLEDEIEYNSEGAFATPWKNVRGIALTSNAEVKIPDTAKYFYISVSCRTGSIRKGETLHASTGLYVYDEVFGK